MADSTERLLAFAELLLGAAHADNHFHEREREVVRELLVDLHGSEELPAEVDARLDNFHPAEFELEEIAKTFTGDSEDDRKKLLLLIGSVHEADEELDLAEDEYLRQLAAALELPDTALNGLTIDVEVEELREGYTSVAKPPPIPGKRDESVDVDV